MKHGPDESCDEPIEDLIGRVRARAAQANPDDWSRGPERLPWARGFQKRWWSRRGAIRIAVTAFVLATGWIGATLSTGTERTASTGGAAARAEVPERRAVATTTTVPSSLADHHRRDALAKLPSTLRAECRQAPGLVNGGNGVVCAVATGVSLELRWFDTEAATRSALQERLRRLAPDADESCVAARATPAAPRAWLRQNAATIRGEFACGHSTRGAELVWSVNELQAVCVLVRSDGDTAAALRWWNTTDALT